MNKALRTFLLYISICISSIVFAQSDTLSTIDLETDAFIKPIGYHVKTLKIDSSVLNNRLSDILTKESSVFIKQYGPGNLASISVRGTSSSQNQVFWNGIPMSSVTLGQVNLNLIRPLTSNSIDMVYGGGESGSYPGAIGSSIYLNNKLEFNKQNTFSYSAFYGAFETYRQNGVVSITDSTKTIMFSWNSARAINDFEYYNTYNQTYQNRSESKQVNLDYSLHCAYKLSPFSQLKLNLLMGDSKKDIPRPISIHVPLQKQIQNDETRLITLGWNYEKKSEKFGLQWGHQKLRNYFDDLATTNKASIININQHFLQARAITRINSKGQIVWSWDSEFSNVESTGFTDSKVRTLHFLNVGYKYDIHPNLLLNINLKPTKLDSRKTDILVNMAFEYSSSNTFKLYSHLSKNVRYPTLNDLYWSSGGNENLNSEKSIQFELGLDKRYKQINIQANLYNNIVDDWILWQPQSSGLWSPENVYKVQSYGLELGLERLFRINSKHQIKLSVNSTIGRAKNTRTHKDLIYMPRRKFLYSANYKNPYINVHLSGEYSSSFYITSDNTGYMPQYGYHNIGLTKDIKINKLNIKLNMFINNLFNRDYQVVANYPMPRRHINMGFILSQG